MTGTHDTYRERELADIGVPATVVEGAHPHQRVVTLDVTALDDLMDRLERIRHR